MNTKTFHLDNGKKLEVSWEGGWKNTSARLDNEVIGTIPKLTDLKAGKNIQLPDGDTLNLRLFQSKLISSSTSLQALVNGKLVEGSGTEDEVKYKDSTGCVFIIAVLAILSSLFFFAISPLSGLISIGTGLFYLVSGFFVKQKSETALIVVITAYIIDGLIGIISLVNQGAVGVNLIGAIGIRIAALAILIPGVAAIKNMKKQSFSNTRPLEVSSNEIIFEGARNENSSQRIEAGYGAEVVVCPNCKTVNSLSVTNCKDCQKDLSKEKSIRNPYL